MCDITVIIPTFNRAKYLSGSVDSIIQQKFSPEQFEILIIDNGSTDKTKEVSEAAISACPDYNIRYFYEPVPGLLSGRHRGALEAKGDILVFIDDDIQADPGWLMAIHEAFKEPDVHLVGGKNLPNYEAEPPSWLKYMWSPTPYGGKECGYLSLLDMGGDVKEIDPNYVWGLNFSIRKKTFFELGGFSPDNIPKNLQRFQGDGETGLTLKIKEKGYKAIYQPRALIYHAVPLERMTIPYFENRMFYQGVADSFTEIRRRGGLFKAADITSGECSFFARFKYALKMTFNNPFLLKDIILKKLCCYFSKDVRIVNEKMNRAYKEGYQFHQNEVKNDPKLLQWVLKENFLDYRLPS